MGQQNYVFTFQDPSGAPLAGGKVTLRLTQDASTNPASSSNASQVLRGRVAEATLDSNGSATILLWPTDQLDPEVVYTVRAYTANGLQVWEDQITLITSVEFLIQEINVASTFLLESGSGSILLETSS